MVRSPSLHCQGESLSQVATQLQAPRRIALPEKEVTRDCILGRTGGAHNHCKSTLLSTSTFSNRGGMAAKSQPLSIESLLQKQKAEKEAAAKVRPSMNAACCILTARIAL